MIEIGEVKVGDVVYAIFYYNMYNFKIVKTTVLRADVERNPEDLSIFFSNLDLRGCPKNSIAPMYIFKSYEAAKKYIIDRYTNRYEAALLQFDNAKRDIASLKPLVDNIKNDSIVYEDITYNLAACILDKVNEFHRNQEYTKATDTILDFIVDCLDTNDMGTLDALMELMIRDLQVEASIYDEFVFARIINVLALTVKYDGALENRQKLKTAYAYRIESMEGALAGQRAIKYL